MMSLLTRLFIRNQEDVLNPDVKKAYAALSSIVGIVLNLLLCAAKIVIGLLSHSVAIWADGFNNLSDAGTNLVSLLGFRMARYGKGSAHPFGHGRIEWIMGIFASVAVALMGIKLAGASVGAIANPELPLFNVPVAAVLILSILVKLYMYGCNKRFAKITDSETLKAAAADCIGDSLATGAVLISSVFSYVTKWKVDGYCGFLVSVFISFAGIKSLWEVLGRIMGRTADEDTLEAILQIVGEYEEIAAVRNVMVHDYGFGYFVVSMLVEGYKKDSEKLYAGINEISYRLHQKFRCDCFIQTAYLLRDEGIMEHIRGKLNSVLETYHFEIRIDNFRMLDSGSYINIAFDMLYPAQLQKREDEICRRMTEEIESENPRYRAVINGIMRRERFELRPFWR